MARLFEASVNLSTKASVSATGTIVTTLPRIESKGTVFASEFELRRVAAHFEDVIRTYVPTTPGDQYLVKCMNPDTGLVDMVVGDDPAEALRRLSESFADDL